MSSFHSFNMRSGKVLSLSICIFCVLITYGIYTYFMKWKSQSNTFELQDKLEFSVDFDLDELPKTWKFNNGVNLTRLAAGDVEDLLKDPDAFKRHIIHFNKASRVLNEENFGRFSTSNPPSFVFIIQVHNRPEHLVYLINSLKRVQGIQHALLIFSHDYVSRKLQEVVGAIEFARVLQIFFPYSNQVYLTSFPGTTPGDCPPRPKDPNISCLNKDWKDIAGHYRETKFSQMKHHWFWKLIYVTEILPLTKNCSAPFILLEEDHYVLEDILHVLNLTKQMDKKKTDLISLGSYVKQPTYMDSGKVYVSPWDSSKHNMGMVFDREILQRLQPCWNLFCMYDDYNWDWSLHSIGQTCLSPQMTVLHFAESPRVYHIGVCNGTHFSKSNCNIHSVVSVIAAKIESQAQLHLFPDTLHIQANNLLHRTIYPMKNGGWADVRDHSLCLSFARHSWVPLASYSNLQGRSVKALEPLVANSSLSVF